jgi:large subunit ribosomal protein L10
MENIGRECKKLMRQEVTKRIEDSSNIFITSFKSMGVSEQDQLRQKLGEIDASLLVVKNRIARQVFDQLDLQPLSPLMKGLTALTLGGSDALAVSKVLVNFAGKNEGFSILGGYVDEQVVDLNSIRSLALIPSREVLLTKLVCALKSPIQGFATTLFATIKKFVVAIDKIKEKKK